MADPTIIRSNTPKSGAPQNPFNNNPGAYEGMRNQARQEAGNAQSQSMDAITRRYAAMGNLNSGAYTQAQQNSGRDAAQQGQNEVNKINMQEQDTANKGALQTQQLGEQHNEFEEGQGQQQAQFETEIPLKSRQLDLEASQQGLDAAANQMNYDLGQSQGRHSGGLLGGGGVLGLGQY